MHWAYCRTSSTKKLLINRQYTGLIIAFAGQTLQVKELDLLEKIEKIANPLKNEGEWISYLDIVEDGDRLVLKEMKQEGKCGTECKTIQKAAEGILESADTDIAEKLWQVSSSEEALKVVSYPFLNAIWKEEGTMPTEERGVCQMKTEGNTRRRLFGGDKRLTFLMNLARVVSRKVLPRGPRDVFAIFKLKLLDLLSEKLLLFLPFSL